MLGATLNESSVITLCLSLEMHRAVGCYGDRRRKREERKMECWWEENSDTVLWDNQCHFVNHCLMGFRLNCGAFKRSRLPVPILEYSNSGGLGWFFFKFPSNSYGQSDMGSTACQPACKFHYSLRLRIQG